jgi:hypothetical protein
MQRLCYDLGKIFGRSIHQERSMVYPQVQKPAHAGTQST